MTYSKEYQDCTIDKVIYYDENNVGVVVYEIKHNRSLEIIHTITDSEAYKVAILLNRDYICSQLYSFNL